MAKITYITHDNKTHTIDVQNGLTVMEGAVQNDIPGIDADCGGGMACATCHVYVKEEWFDKVNEKSELKTAIEKAITVDGQVIIEQFISGTEVTCSAFTQNGKMSAIVVIGRIFGQQSHIAGYKRIASEPKRHASLCRSIVAVVRNVNVFVVAGKFNGLTILAINFRRCATFSCAVVC